MDVTVTIGGKKFAVDFSQAKDISIPVRFDDTQVSWFNAPPATRAAYVGGHFTGDVSLGGSCNCDILTFSPHTSGTHTECIGHLSNVLLTVHELLEETLIPATLITVHAQPVSETKDTYIPELQPEDTLITRAMLEKTLHGGNKDFFAALVVRTEPNGPGKMTRNYSQMKPPFFSIEAMRFLEEINVKHLLADIPSIDRPNDEGKLTNHHLFWGIEQGTNMVNEKKPSSKTITELVYVNNMILDGVYLLNLQVAAMLTDAAPSRPLLFEVKPL